MPGRYSKYIWDEMTWSHQCVISRLWTFVLDELSDLGYSDYSVCFCPTGWRGACSPPSAARPWLLCSSTTKVWDIWTWARMTLGSVAGCSCVRLFRSGNREQRLFCKSLCWVLFRNNSPSKQSSSWRKRFWTENAIPGVADVLLSFPRGLCFPFCGCSNPNSCLCVMEKLTWICLSDFIFFSFSVFSLCLRQLSLLSPLTSFMNVNS